MSLHAPKQAASGLPERGRIVLLITTIPFSARCTYMTQSPTRAGNQHTCETGRALHSHLGPRCRELKQRFKTHMFPKPHSKSPPSILPPPGLLGRQPSASPLPRLSPGESWASKFAELEGGRHRSIGEFNRIRSV